MPAFQLEYPAVRVEVRGREEFPPTRNAGVASANVGDDLDLRIEMKADAEPGAPLVYS